MGDQPRVTMIVANRSRVFIGRSPLFLREQTALRDDGSSLVSQAPASPTQSRPICFHPETRPDYGILVPSTIAQCRIRGPLGRVRRSPFQDLWLITARSP